MGAALSRRARAPGPRRRCPLRAQSRPRAAPAGDHHGPRGGAPGAQRRRGGRAPRPGGHRVCATAHAGGVPGSSTARGPRPLAGGRRTRRHGPRPAAPRDRGGPDGADATRAPPRRAQPEAARRVRRAALRRILARLRGGVTVPAVVERSELIQPEPAQAFASLLDVPVPDLSAGAPLPLTWHWLYLLERPAQADLGADGHPIRGVVPEPPGPGLRRMWA